MQTVTIHLFVFDTMSDWEYGYLAAGIANPQFQRYPGRFALRTVASASGPVLTMGGLRIVPDGTLDQVAPADSGMLVLPGGTAWDQGRNADAAALASRFLAQGNPVAAICGATAGLARAGLLDEVAHTSNAREYLAATGYRGSAHYRDLPAVTSGNLITASAMAPLEFAREAFALLGVYSPAVLESWYNLHKTGDGRYFADLMQA